MKIGVIGAGTVGRATARTYLEHCEEVRVHDKVKECCTAHTWKEVIHSDLIFVCLPEEEVENFFYSVGDLKGVCADKYSSYNYVLKSTVPIGTTRRLAEKYHLPNLVHSPEFLTERCALTDAQMPARNIIGEPEGKGNVHGSQCGRSLQTLYEKRFPGVPVLVMFSDESEAVKLMTNAFFAVKVSFFNEMYQLASKLGFDWETVRAGILSDGRISHSHTQVPGPDGKLGFGGKCLPKDLEMLTKQIDDLGHTSCDIVNSVICSAARNRNKLIDRKDA